MQGLAENLSDPSGQRAAFTFLGRGVTIWGAVAGELGAPNGNDSQPSGGLPGFERFIYERLVPAAFRVLSSPEFNLKDGQTVQVSPELYHIFVKHTNQGHKVLHEIANFLQCVGRARGQEAFDFFVSVFLPSQNWPPEAAMEFVTKLRDLDQKTFRKYFTEFVRSSRSQASS